MYQTSIVRVRFCIQYTKTKTKTSICLAVISSGGDPAGWGVPDWSPETDDVINKKFGIASSLLTLTAPGACILKDPQEAADLAHKANVLAAKLRDQFPKRYGFFASLANLIDKELALKELAYAFDVLKADGIILFTRYGPGKHYLGHPDFKEIWAELNRRHAVVFIHPTHPVDTEMVGGLSQPIIQYPFETTTTALDMLHSKTVRNNPNCKIILSHAGGTLPYLIGRPASVLTSNDQELKEFWDDASSFYYDVAVSGTENVLRTLEKFAKPDHILYGSDTPYAHDGIIDFHTKRLDQYEFADPGMRKAIDRDNALKLFPQFKN